MIIIISGKAGSGKMNYKIKIGKQVNTKDIDEIHQLLNWGNYRPEQWSVIKKRSSFMVQVIENKKTIGFARCVDDSEMCMIYDVIVHPHYQKKGIGTLLMNEVLKYIQTNHFATVSLFYDTNNNTLTRFYEKFGFIQIPNAMRLKK